MSSYYNNIPIYETLNINYGNIETLDAETIKTKNLYIDTIKTSDNIKTQKITLDNDDIESLSKASTSPFTSDNKKICSKGYIDEQISTNKGVGKNYLVSDVVQGEIFNDYSNNQASGNYSHSEGSICKSSGYYAHSENYNNTASGTSSHSEGSSTIASGSYSHSGGFHTQADQQSQTAIGEYNTTSNTNSLLSIGNGTADNTRSDALVVKSTGEVIINSTKSGTTPTLTLGTYKPITATTALNTSTQADDAIISTKYYVDNNVGVGKNYLVNNNPKGETFNDYTNNKASGTYSHAEGNITTASGTYSHSEGYHTTASGDCSHAEGNYTTASKISAHAEGSGTTASGIYSHAEGTYTTASGSYSHAEGTNNTASGEASHAEGLHATASGSYSHASGKYVEATEEAQTVVGKYNITNQSALFIVGNGTATDSRSNALMVHKDGKIGFNGNFTMYVGYVDIVLNYKNSSDNDLSYNMNVFGQVFFDYNTTPSPRVYLTSTFRTPNGLPNVDNSKPIRLVALTVNGVDYWANPTTNYVFNITTPIGTPQGYIGILKADGVNGYIVGYDDTYGAGGSFQRWGNLDHIFSFSMLPFYND